MSFKKEGQITPIPMQDFIGLIYLTTFWRFHLMMDYVPSQDSIPSLAGTVTAPVSLYLITIE